MSTTPVVYSLKHEDTLSDAAVDALAGTFLDESHYDILISGVSADVYKPDGSPLLKYRPGAVPVEALRRAWPCLKDIEKTAGVSFNRGIASGMPRTRARKQGGKVSSTLTTERPVKSSIIGYFDRYARIPYCRQTAFNLNHPELWSDVLPLARAADEAFKSCLPDRHAAQMERVEATHPAWIVSGTAFTTITVNKNWQTATHTDAGDLPEGFGVMCVMDAGKYDGCFLCFPKYRVAVDMRSGGVLMADVHEYHGNTPLRPRGRFERISCVFYYRKKMVECGSPEEELERAKSRKTIGEDDPDA